MKTFVDFVTALRKEIWPAGEASTLKAVHTRYFQAAMIDLQTWVPCLRAFNTTQFPFCATYWWNAVSVIEQLNGFTRGVYTVANGDFRDPVHYWSATKKEVDCWSKRLWDADLPETDHLKQGYYPASINTDDKFERARTGIWAIDRGRIYVAPYIQSNEIIIVEWDGPNYQWNDTDGVNENWWTYDVQEAIKWYVRWMHETNWGEVQLGREFKSNYDLKLSDLMWICREKTRQQHDEACTDQTPNQFLTSEQLQDDEVPDSTTTFETLFVADWGITGQPLTDVAEAVNGLNPKNIIFGGDNSYGQDPVLLLDHFLAEKKWLVVGNHDRDLDPGLSSFLAIYDYLNNGRYYTFLDGPVHYFVISTDPRETDSGYVDATALINGSMVGWLTAMAAISTARWKVVVGHHAPYTSEVLYTPGNQWLRLNYKAMGFDAYINGHAHAFEIVEVNGFPYISAGIGGHSLRAFGANTSGTIIKQYNENFGFLKLTANCNEFAVKLIDRTGTEQYSYSLTK